MADSWIGLSDAIAELRAELMLAMTAGHGEGLHFELGPVELEFTLEVRKEIGTDAGIRWGIVSLGAKGAVDSSDGHRLKLVLQPKDTKTGLTAEVGSSQRH